MKAIICDVCNGTGEWETINFHEVWESRKEEAEKEVRE